MHKSTNASHLHFDAFVGQSVWLAAPRLQRDPAGLKRKGSQ